MFCAGWLGPDHEATGNTEVGMTAWQQRATQGFACFLLSVVIGCSATFVNHGYAPTDLELEEIIVGVDDRASVEETIGRPSSAGVLQEGGWYYVSSRVRHFTYKEPEVIDRQLVAVSFDKRGVVSNVERFTLEDGRVIALSRRVTASAIKGITFLQQMLGNIGNFDFNK